MDQRDLVGSPKVNEGIAERPEERRSGLDDEGLRASFFADGRSIRAACSERHLDRQKQLEYLRVIRESHREVLIEIAGAPSALKTVIGVLERSPELGSPEALKAAWANTTAEWARRGEPGWTKRYTAQLDRNRKLIVAAIDSITVEAKHRYEIVFRFEERVRATLKSHDDVLSSRQKGPQASGVCTREDTVLLTREMREAMSSRVALFESRGEEALDTMTRTNLRLVARLATKFYHHPQNQQSLDDLFQAGTLGLIAALQRFDPERGTSLTTYASPWIRNFMARGILEDQVIRVPERERATARRFRSAAQELTQALGREPHDDEIAAVTGHDLKKVRRAEPSVKSLHRGKGSEEDECFSLDISESRIIQRGDHDSSPSVDISRMMSRVFDGNDRALMIMEARQRGSSASVISLKHIAAELGMTRERARQLEAEAIGLLTDYLIIQSAGDRRRFEVGVRVLQPFERPLIRNLVAEDYMPLASGELLGPDRKPVSAVDQKRAIIHTATALVLMRLGERQAAATLPRVELKGGGRLSAYQTALIQARLFGPLQNWEETGWAMRKRFGAPVDATLDARVPERQFRSLIESIAPSVRDIWRRDAAAP